MHPEPHLPSRRAAVALATHPGDGVANDITNDVTAPLQSAARQQLDEMSMEVHTLRAGMTDAQSMGARAAQLADEVQNCRETLQDMELLLKTATQERAQERTRRIDAETLLEDQIKRSATSSKFAAFAAEVNGHGDGSSVGASGANSGRLVKAARIAVAVSGHPRGSRHKGGGGGGAERTS